MREDSLGVRDRAELEAETFIVQYANEIVAGLTILVVLLLLFAVDRIFRRQTAGLSRSIAGGELDPVVQTRLRFVRRFVAAAIVVLGFATALSQFTALDRFAASVLTSGAIAAAVIGFAAQQTLANLIAGVLLAVTQPIRIGDLVTLEDDTGVVEDIRLTYTFLRTGNDARLIVPNEKLANSVLRNDSIVTDTVGVEVELWLSNDADELRALEVIEAALAGTAATVKAVTFEGTTLTVAGPAVPPLERPVRETELRHGSLRALRAAGLR